MKAFIISSLCFLVNLASAQVFQDRIDTNVGALRIDSIGKIIEELKTYNPRGNNRYLSYWEAYACYKGAILSSVLKRSEDAEKFVETGIEILEAIKGKTTEDYALLGMLKNYQINFSGWIKTIRLSGQAKSMAQKAIEVNGDNLRAYLVLGINDYFTPELYGGKSRCEEYFKTALSLPDRTSENGFDPTWGKDEVYYYLLVYYKNRKDSGDQVLFNQLKKEAITKYPASRRLSNISY